MLDPEAVVTDRPSLASAYLPFHRSDEPEAYRRATAEDLRWALAQPDTDWRVALAMVREVGRRLVERPAPDANLEAAKVEAGRALAVLFDVLSGQFDRAGSHEVSEPRDLETRDLVKGAACSAILAAEDYDRGSGLKEYADRARQTVLGLLANPGETSNLTASAAVLAEINAFPFRLAPIDLPPLLDLSGRITAAADKEEISAAGQAHWQRRQRFTVGWLNALRDAAIAGDLPAAWWLARPVVASGLSDLALTWLSSAETPASVEEATVLDWLSSAALPAVVPGGAATPPRQRLLDYAAVSDLLLKICYGLWPGREPRRAAQDALEETDAVAAGFAMPELRELFARVYPALGYTPDIRWKTVGGARIDALGCLEQMLKRLVQEFVHRGGDPFRHLPPALLRLLVALDETLAPKPAEIAPTQHETARRIATSLVALLRELLDEKYSKDGDEQTKDAANLEGWKRCSRSVFHW